ncbi:hypothetical protein MJO29_007150 [Puccinia striiformis f. sp. tritici]|nr:hypothetical protein MJO29_007150 [Puccinia striiformis f. sp. tritici]
MSDSNNQNRIPLLNDNNFIKWKNAVYSYCQQKAIYLFLESDRASTASPEQLDSWLEKKGQAAGVITANLGDENHARFVTDENRNEAHVLWKTLNDHFLANNSQHHSLTFQNFLQLGFTGTLPSFLHVIDTHIAKMRACGMTIRVPVEGEPIVNGNLLAEQIIALLPSSYDHTKEILFTKRPLTLKIIREHLDAKCLDFAEATTTTTTTPTIKTESALKAAIPFCENGKHNPATHHPSEKCYQLYPHLDTRKKGRKKAHVAQTDPLPQSDDDCESIASREGAYHCVSTRKAHLADRAVVSIFLDSGCSDHMFPNQSDFTDYAPGKSSVYIADGKSLPILGSGFVAIKNAFGDIHSFKALHVPGLSTPLVSFGRLFLKNCDLVREGPSDFVMVDTHANVKLFTGTVQGKILVISGTIVSPSGQSNLVQSFRSTQTDAELIHRRAGHPSAEALKLMFGVDYSTLSCESFRLSKSHRLPFSGTLPTPKRLLDYVYMDLSGKISPPTIGGGLYYFKITDAFSSFKHIYILSSKSQAFEKFKIYCNEVKNYHNLTIRNVVTDGGGEFCSKEFEEFYQNTGIIHHVTAPYTPQQNSIAERGNCTTSEKARAMLKQANLPAFLWGEAVSTAVLYENITPMKHLKWTTPHELWYGLPFNLNRLRTFGCKAYVNIPKERRQGKFGDTAKQGILVGYRQGIHNWRILTSGTRVEFSHDVVFDETIFPGISPGSSAGSLIPSSFDEDDDIPIIPSALEGPSSSSDAPDQFFDAKEELPDSPLTPGIPTGSSSEDRYLPAVPAPAVSSSSRPKPAFEYVPASQPAPKAISSSIDTSNILTSKRRAHLVNKLFTTAPFYEAIFAMSVASDSPIASVPKTYKQAINSPEVDSWKEAIQAELDAMVRLDVWDVVPIPRSANLLGSLWVFRKKYDAHGNLVKFKARLCAQGSAQQSGVDFNETYAPTGRASGLCTALTIGVSENMDIHQMDVRNAFLNGNLEEVIYLRCPAGLTIPPNHCLKLKKSIYGLKQAPRVWYRQLSDFFTSINFSASPADPCLFVSNVEVWRCFVHVYVDDLAIISHDVNRFKKLVNDRFLMDDLGPANSLLASTPMIPNTRLDPASPSEIAEFNQLNISYRRAVGSINYIATATQPDICFAVSQLSQHLENPGIKHWRAYTHLLRYMSATKSLSVRIGGGDSCFRIYTDADWANCPEFRRSYSGYLVTWGDSILAWKSKKQASVSTSTMEAEYRSLYDGVQEAIWLNALMVSATGSSIYPVSVYCDNQAAIALSSNPLANQRTKHIDVKYHFIREAVEKGWVNIHYISTGLMPADGLTKSLPIGKHVDLLNFLKMKISSA